MKPRVSLAERIRFPEALLIALLLHLMVLFFGDSLDGFLLGSTVPPEVLSTPEPLRFTFVDLPEEVLAEMPPETADLSDADRRARGERPPEEMGDSPVPYSEGNTSMVEITPPGSAEASRVEAAGSPEASLGEGFEEAGESLPEPPVPEREAPDVVPEEKPGPGQRLQRILQALRDVSRSQPRGFDSRFDHREGTRIREFGGLSFETRDFDWGDYARRLTEIIRSNWRIPLAAQLGEKGKCSYRFTIERDGTISEIQRVASSGIPPLDSAAHQALLASSPLPPLPERFPGERETVTCAFYYNLPIQR